MDEQKLQAQVPEEKLEEVSGGFSHRPSNNYWYYVCNKCQHEEYVSCPLFGMTPDIYAKNYAQSRHDTVRGKTRSCKDGEMIYRGTVKK